MISPMEQFANEFYYLQFIECSLGKKIKIQQQCLLQMNNYHDLQHRSPLYVKGEAVTRLLITHALKKLPFTFNRNPKDSHLISRVLTPIL